MHLFREIEARTKTEKTIEIPFKPEVGAPQSSILSASPFITFTADLLPPGTRATNIIFADNVIKIIKCHHKSKKMIAIRTQKWKKSITD